MQTIINKISLAVILLVVVLFLVDKSFLGYNYIGAIPFICFVFVMSYIGRLEKKAEIDKRVKVISSICFFVIVIIGLLLILKFPEIFNTYGF